jgi:CBS-domain-containing membrane protein
MLVQTCLRQTNRSTRTAGDAMRPPGPQVCNDMFVDAALSVLISARTRHLVICDEDGRCTGLVTRTQLTAHRSTARADKSSAQVRTLITDHRHRCRSTRCLHLDRTRGQHGLSCCCVWLTLPSRTRSP